jgi:Ca-activated chloride channel family protein
MTDDPELDRLARGLRAAPAPDPAARRAALARAMESFDAAQEPGRDPRQTPARPRAAGFLNGVLAMFKTLTSPAGLAATASVAVLGVGLVMTLPFAPPPATTPLTLPADRPATAPVEAPAPVPLQAEAPAPEPALPLAVADAGADASAAARSEAAAPELAFANRPQRALAPRAPAPAMPQAPAANLDAQQLHGLSGIAAGDAGSSPDLAPAPAESRDRFAAGPANPVRVVAEEPVSTFSVDVDTASWAVVRSFLAAGQMPPPEAVRIEEMVNYFPYDYAAPGPDDPPFLPAVAVFPTPWNEATRLVRIALQGRLPQAGARAPVDLVFLIDTSGSMQGADRLGLLKSGLAMLLEQLRPEDRIAIVAYAGSAGEVLPPTPASERATILAALGALEAGGSTAGGAGLDLAYRIAGGLRADGRVTRVLLATDGDFNVGPSDTEDLRAMIAARRAEGVLLSVLGFGRGNLNDALMQALAQDGNGQAAYIDTASEARKVLADQLAGALEPIAGDVKIQVEWNPAAVAEYRLIGYETRALSRADFANDRVDAGDIGAGHAVTALYEVVPAGSPARLTDPLRYGAAAPAAGAPADEMGWLKLRYKGPGETESRLIEAPIPVALAEPDAEARFAAAIAGFGQLLAGGVHLGGWGWDDAIALAQDARGPDPFGWRAEAVGLMRTARLLAAR